MFRFKVIQFLFSVCSLQGIFAAEKCQLTSFYALEQLPPQLIPVQSPELTSAELTEKDFKIKTFTETISNNTLSTMSFIPEIKGNSLYCLSLQRYTYPTSLSESQTIIAITMHSSQLPSDFKITVEKYLNIFDKQKIFDLARYSAKSSGNDFSSIEKLLEIFYNAGFIYDFMIKKIQDKFPELNN